MLQITNSLTGQKEPFVPMFSGKVSLYVCGITPYDFSHIGHGRCYVVFDMVYRFLLFSGYQVSYCRNFTDIDDKLLRKAEQEYGDAAQYPQIAQKFINAYLEDMQALRCLIPDHQPRVTQTIPQIIAFVQGLIEQGAAYEVDGSVYFRVRQFAKYGKLSKQDINDLRAGARIDVDDTKEDPLDFALWKADKPNVSYESPWGYGRPGWHIECSAMVQDYFQGSIDIHGGGMDLMFPHHENEIAQSESLYPAPFVKYWLHNAFVRINKEKMSKSLQNFLTLKDVLKDCDAMVLRFYFLKHYYRGPLDFSFEDLAAAEKTYKRLVQFFNSVQLPNDLNFLTKDQVASCLQVQDNAVVNSMVACLEDDFNTSALFGVLFESLEHLEKDEQAKQAVKIFIMQVLGLSLEPIFEKQIEITPEIQALLVARDDARKQKDWKKADEIRDQLQGLGVQIHDKKI